MADAAVRGTALLAVLLAAGAWLRPAVEPVAERVVRLEGEGIPAWYEADDLAAAAREGGFAPPVVASDQVRDGDVVRLVDGWALPDREVARVESVALGRRLSLNHASAGELESLPGIGPALAARIVGDRPFRSLEDLDRVKGIGPKKIAALRPLVEP